MLGIDLDKGIQVLSISENNGKRKAKYTYGTQRTGYSFGEAEIRKNQFGDEYFLAHKKRVFMDDLLRKE